jgi:hypothetical protein
MFACFYQATPYNVLDKSVSRGKHHEKHSQISDTFCCSISLTGELSNTAYLYIRRATGSIGSSERLTGLLYES